MENRVTAVFSTWFADDLLELLVQILLPLGQNLQPLSPHPLQVHLLHVSTHTTRQMWRNTRLSFTVYIRETLSKLRAISTFPCTLQRRCGHGSINLLSSSQFTSSRGESI